MYLYCMFSDKPGLKMTEQMKITSCISLLQETANNTLNKYIFYAHKDQKHIRLSMLFKL